MCSEGVSALLRRRDRSRHRRLRARARGPRRVPARRSGRRVRRWRDAELCIEVMARLHSRVVGRRLTTRSWPGCRPSTAISTAAAWSRRGGDWEPFVANFGHLVDPTIVAAGPRYLAGLPDLHHRMGRGRPDARSTVTSASTTSCSASSPTASPDRARRLAGDHRLQGRPRPRLPADARTSTTDVRREHERRARRRATTPSSRQPASPATRRRSAGTTTAWRPVAVRVRGHHRRRPRPGQRAGHRVHDRPRRRASAQTIVDLDLAPSLLPGLTDAHDEPARPVPARRPGRRRHGVGPGDRPGHRVGPGRRRLRRRGQRPAAARPRGDRGRSRRAGPAGADRRRRHPRLLRGARRPDDRRVRPPRRVGEQRRRLGREDGPGAGRHARRDLAGAARAQPHVGLPGGQGGGAPDDARAA